MLVTSAYANKLLRKLNEDRNYWQVKEKEEHYYIAAADEEPVIPDYDYDAVSTEIARIDAMIVKIKHAINLVNTTSEVVVGSRTMTVDCILVEMAQLNNRKSTLNVLRRQAPKTRISNSSYSVASRKQVPEYRYINYDVEQVKADFEKVDAEIAAMQIALDKFNQTFEFELDLEV